MLLSVIILGTKKAFQKPGLYKISVLWLAKQQEEEFFSHTPLEDSLMKMMVMMTRFLLVSNKDGQEL
jgi:hypothetical protein